jgi:arsenate reductase (thioredoxin)
VTPPRKTRVLFVCIGNSCRSQMAEGFARTYGDDVMIAASAGLAPALGVAQDTIRTMDEKNIDVRDQFPKSIQQLGRAQFDLAINMSGFGLPEDVSSPTRNWDVEDPIGEDYETYCKIRDQIEALVMGLILELRRADKPGTRR